MRLLHYKDLNLRRVRAAFDKGKATIEAGDFRSADVKKLNAGPYYRAKLDHANRLLLKFGRVASAEGGSETVCLALEVIENHADDRSRFLRGATVDEARIEREPPPDTSASGVKPDAVPLRWLGRGRTVFELLDKPLVFDDAQESALHHPAPLVVIGSAGSGKTAVTLARLREAEGRVLHLTLSACLAQSARALHGAHGFENPKQEVDFLSDRELLETLRVPTGREVTLPVFAAWCERHRQGLRPLAGLDAQALFEEFRGVIGAQPEGPLALADYLALGTRQSLLDPAQREVAHGLFARYRAWLDASGLFDSNLVAHAWRTQIAEPAGPVYDFVVVDEVRRRLGPYKYPAGFFADPLHDVLAELPPWLWSDKRRKRSYVNQVLARAEVHRACQPARRLWVRTRTGHYLPNPDMRSRVGEVRRPAYEVLALDWLEAGCGSEDPTFPGPREAVERARAAIEGEAAAPEAHEAHDEQASA